jgi:hypothetical protein
MLPLAIAIIGLVITIALIGIGAGLVGAGGMAASAYAKKKENRVLVLLAFGMILLFGIGWVLALASFIFAEFWLSILSVFAGLSTIACAIVGIVFSKKVIARREITKKVIRVLLYVLFCIGILAGAVVVIAMLGLLWMFVQLPAAAIAV